MQKIAVIVNNKSEEIETIVPTDIWRRAGLLVQLISTDKKKNIQLDNGVKLSCNSLLSEENLSKYNAIFLPGGQGYTFYDNPLCAKLTTFIKKNFNNQAYKFLAICASPTLFKTWNLLTPNIKATCFPTMSSKLGNNYVNKPVVIDGNLITSQAPGTAHLFAFAVVELFLGKKVATKIANDTYFNI